jgi:4-hydroxy-tetrahydrodipicolinate reductase
MPLLRIKQGYMMKVALLGKGKTGGKVLELLKAKNMFHTVFDSTNTPTLEKLKGHDVIICFFSGEVFKNYLNMVIDSKIPLICGSTGFELSDYLHNTLSEHKIKWIYATNFSLGMNLVQQMIKVLEKANRLFSQFNFSIHEVHHTKKLDSPSGTALSWKKWLNHEVEISSERTGDVIGLHDLTLNTPFEKITIKHEALDRTIFAEGALFAAKLILENENIPYGLNLFQDIIQKELL